MEIRSRASLPYKYHMTILILNWRDIKHPLSGGAEISLFENAKHWVKHGASVIWFASSFPDASPEETIENVHIIRRGSHFTVHMRAYFYFIHFLKQTVDVIIDNFHFIPFFTPLYAKDKKILAFINEPAKEAWFKNINIIIAIVGYIMEPLFFLPYRNIPFLTGSASIASELPFLGISKKQITVVPHGVRVSKSVKSKRAKVPTLLYLAQLSPDKGIKDAIEMLSLLRKIYPSIMLFVAGKAISKKYEKKMLQLIKVLEISSKNITFLGFVPEREKYLLLQKAWILVHPSTREGWGLTVIEAASFGTPTVGYNVSGLSDSIQNMQTGILTDENAPESLSKSITTLFNDKKLYDKLSKQAKEYAKKFKWEKSGEQSFDIIKKIYENKKKA